MLGNEGVDGEGYPNRYVDRAALLRLLHDRRHVELTRHLEQFQADFESNPRCEYWPADAARAFAVADAGLRRELDAWASATPRSFAPFLARGAWWTALGHLRREMYPDDLRAMEEAFKRGLSDLDRALELRPRLVAALLLQMQIRKASSLGNPAQPMARAMKICPDCFLVRLTYLSALEPRWGGSYGQMLSFAQTALAGSNPRLRLLVGYVEAAKADALFGDKQLEYALVTIDRALALGETADFLLQRAEILDAHGEVEQALRALDRARELRPGSPEVLFQRARVEFKREHYEVAAQNLLAGLRIDPASREGRNLFKPIVQGLAYRGRQFFQAGRQDEALRLYQLGLQLDPANRELERAARRGDAPAPAGEREAARQVRDRVG